MNGSGKSTIIHAPCLLLRTPIKPQRKTTDFQLLLTMITTGVTVALQPIFTQENLGQSGQQNFICPHSSTE
ncbi:hypothetical protein ACLB1T_00610 [Escherichia coli]